VDGAKAVKVWDAATGERVRRPAMETGRNPGGVAFSADGTKVAAACWDATVKVRDATTGRELVTFRGHRGKVNAVAFCPAGDLAASAGDDGAVCVWDATTGKEVVPATKHVGFVWGVAFSPDGRRLASASGYSGKGQVRIWPLPPVTRPSAGVRGERRRSPPGHALPPAGISVMKKVPVHIWAKQYETSAPLADARLTDLTTGETWRTGRDG